MTEDTNRARDVKPPVTGPVNLSTNKRQVLTYIFLDIFLKRKIFSITIHVKESYLQDIQKCIKKINTLIQYLESLLWSRKHPKNKKSTHLQIAQTLSNQRSSYKTDPFEKKSDDKSLHHH